jgi:hypothetical protein
VYCVIQILVGWSMNMVGNWSVFFEFYHFFLAQPLLTQSRSGAITIREGCMLLLLAEINCPSLNLNVVHAFFFAYGWNFYAEMPKFVSKTLEIFQLMLISKTTCKSVIDLLAEHTVVIGRHIKM